MRIKIKYLVFLATLAAISIECNKQKKIEPQMATRVAYPEGYRNWTRVKSMVILEGHEHFKAFGGFHHVYANDIALEALKQNRSFPKGAVLIFELYQERTENHAIIEGERLVIGVMEKDQDRFVESEGWGFEDFKFTEEGYQRMVTDARIQCLSCHRSKASTDFVYSKYLK